MLTSSDGEFQRTRVARDTSGFCAGVPKGVVFGVGDNEGPFSLNIRWPSGIVDLVEGLDSGSKIEVVEGQSSL